MNKLNIFSQTKWLSLVCLVGLAAIAPSFATAEVTFKRVKVTDRKVGSLIDIQIQPDESYYHQEHEPTKKPIIVNPPKTDASTTNHFEWFWKDFDHSVATASLGRLIEAERQLGKLPSNARLPSPSLNTMQDLATKYGPDILLATLDKSVSPALVLAVISVESAGKAAAVSSAGAVGLMQLIPDTAKRFGVTDSTDPKQNIKGGVAYLDWLLREFQKDPVLALAGYNAGENAVKKHQSVPPFPETRGYVPKVVAAWNVAKALCKTPPTYATDGCVFNFKPQVAQQ